MKRFGVTGCARSGTGYTAMLLRAAGITCGHEGAIGPDQVLFAMPPTWGELDGDSSWLATALLPLGGVVVGHQVRHPLDVIRSLTGMRLFATPAVHREHIPYFSVIQAATPSVMDEATEPDAAARYWVEWNRRARSHASVWWRVEDLKDPTAAAAAVTGLGHARGPGEMANAISIVPTDYNSRTFPFMERDDSVTWGDVRPALRAEMQELAAEYGYGGG